ncbi:MAG TPA: hypothetical protein DD417_00485 [Elusimicrobia bacterium]|nr:hypothetical protein [Elusimicrobiota bacterium]
MLEGALRLGRIGGAALAAAVLALAGVGAARAADPAAILIEDWSRQPTGKTGIPDGWKGQNWGSPKYDFTIVSESPTKALHLKSRDEGSTISKEVKVDVKRYPLLQWRWKVVTLPRGGDSRKKEADDQGGQIYVTFPRFPSAVRSRVIGYVWDTTAPAGTIVKSEKTGTVTYVIVRSGDAETGRWLTETRNVYEDYRRIYGEEPGEEVGAVSVAIDSNDTHSAAEAFIGEILFRKP